VCARLRKRHPPALIARRRAEGCHIRKARHRYDTCHAGQCRKSTGPHGHAAPRVSLIAPTIRKYLQAEEEEEEEEAEEEEEIDRDDMYELQQLPFGIRQSQADQEEIIHNRDALPHRSSPAGIVGNEGPIGSAMIVASAPSRV